MFAGFSQYTGFEPPVDIRCVTGRKEPCIHRFFDTSPISPSGRLIAVTRLPYENRPVQAGDIAWVVVIDLEAGEDVAVFETRGWESQLGAGAQWGLSDSELYFNDAVANKAVGIKCDPATGERLQMDGPVYMVSPDGKHAAGPCLLRTRVTQDGYGVVVPDEAVPENRGAADDDGLYVTDTSTGEARLLVSFAEICDAVPQLTGSRYDRGAFYGSHVKYNPQGDRLMFVIRFVDDGGEMFPNIVTMNSDGSDIRLALHSDIWKRGGHHPNWTPDGQHVMMNLVMGDPGVMRFVKMRYDGTGLETMVESVIGSGHPTLHPDGRHIVTDAYIHEKLIAFDDGTSPIRWIDTVTGETTVVARIPIVPEHNDETNQWRVDPHPAWDREYRRIAFNAAQGGHRKVFVADMSPLLG